MGIDLQQIHLIITALLPWIVALVAGAIRQDGWNTYVNEGISYALVVGIAIVQALLDGKIGGSPSADFLIVAGYTSAVLHSPLAQPLQQYLQSNIFSFGSSPASAPAQSQAQSTIDAATLAQELLKALNMPTLAVLLAQELVKIRVQAAPQSAPQQQKPIEQRPTVATQAVNPPPTNRGG